MEDGQLPDDAQLNAAVTNGIRRWAVALLAAAALLGCSGGEPEAEPPPAAVAEMAEASTEVAGGAAEEPAADVYTVRGEIVALPEAAGAASSFQVRHEAIDDFKGIGGEVWGMDAMTMPFATGSDVSFADLAVGDKVEFTLAVAWLTATPQQVTSIRKLPADTELTFGPAQPAATADPESPEEG